MCRFARLTGFKRGLLSVGFAKKCLPAWGSLLQTAGSDSDVMHNGLISAEIAAGMLAFKNRIEAATVKQHLSTLH
jgi:hypothetical protein